jgi:hypothetical protein
MSFQFSVSVRNAELDSVETTIGATAILKVFSGAEPANCAAADPAGLLCTITLPADWLAAASGGSKAKLGTWSNAASGTGIAASWRIYETTATTCHIQGNTADMIFDNTNIVAAQVVTVTAFTLTAGNA